MKKLSILLLITTLLTTITNIKGVINTKRQDFSGDSPSEISFSSFAPEPKTGSARTAVRVEK